MISDTIVSLCTAKGKAALSVLRVSGKDALKIVRWIAPFLPPQPESHRIYFGTLKDQEKDLDQALVSYFKKGRSFTGEETLEISCHGGMLYTAILKSLLKYGARQAEKGEFSMQAFSNGKMDLIQTEALYQLIESENEEARKQALFQLKGALSKKFQKLEKDWLFLLSHVEADIDFSLENLSTLKKDQIQEQIFLLEKQVQDLASKYRPFEKLQKGLCFGLFGSSNAGKSSLFNALLDEEKAIVSKEEGTTRDIVEAQVLNEQGLSLLLKDSAGFRDSLSEGEKKGQKKAFELFKDCDFRLILIDLSNLKNLPGGLLESLKSPANTWLIFSKIDVLDLKQKNELKEYILKPNFLKEESSFIKQLRDLKIPKTEKVFCVSSLTKEGLKPLKKEMLSYGALKSDDFLISNSRHYKALLKMRESLKKASSLKEDKDILALELREGLLALYEILGRQIEDKVLDNIFQKFCIGK